jgi:hypothetical protein
VAAVAGVEVASLPLALRELKPLGEKIDGMETFVVRLWTPAPEVDGAGEQPPVLRGLVDHPASGSSTPFAGERELLLLLRARLAEAKAGTRKKQLGARSSP